MKTEKPAPDCEACESPHEAPARSRYTFGVHQVPIPSTSGLDRRGSTFVQPHFEDRALSVRRISAHPVTDGKIIRLNSFASTLSTDWGDRRVSSIPGNVELYAVVDGARRLSVVSADDVSRRVSTGRPRTSFDAPQDFLESARLSLAVPPTPRVPDHHPFAPNSFSSSVLPLTNDTSMEILQQDCTMEPTNSRSSSVSASTSASATVFDGWQGFGSNAPISSEIDLVRPSSERSGPEDTPTNVQSAEGVKEVMAKRGKRITYLAGVVAQGNGLQAPDTAAVPAA
jgi:hypothetical protein